MEQVEPEICNPFFVLALAIPALMIFLPSLRCRGSSFEFWFRGALAFLVCWFMLFAASVYDVNNFLDDDDIGDTGQNVAMLVIGWMPAFVYAAILLGLRSAARSLAISVENRLCAQPANARQAEAIRTRVLRTRHVLFLVISIAMLGLIIWAFAVGADAPYGPPRPPPVGFTGIWVMKYNTGLKETAETWLDGVRHGEARHWARSGRLREVKHYNHGELEGIVKLWDYRGRKEADLRYRSGTESGYRISWTIRDEPHYSYLLQGKHVSREQYLAACDTDPELPIPGDDGADATEE